MDDVSTAQRLKSGGLRQTLILRAKFSPEIASETLRDNIITRVHVSKTLKNKDNTWYMSVPDIA